MRNLFAACVAVSLLLASGLANAESGDVDATIEAVDPDAMTIVLDNGETYYAPPEFNYEGLEPGAKVIIFFTTAGDKRVIDDLILE